MNIEKNKLKNPVVILLNGYPQSGKDTFGNIAEKDYDVINFSTIDTVKSIAKEMGWDGIKFNKDRDMLSDLKDFYTKWFDGPYKESIRIIKKEIIYKYEPQIDFIIIHIREPEEIKKIQEFCNETKVKHCTVFIKRQSMMNLEQNNHADKNVENMSYDHYLNNDGNIYHFINTVKDFLEYLQTIPLENHK